MICDLMILNLGYMSTFYDTATAKGKASGLDFRF